MAAEKGWTEAIMMMILNNFNLMNHKYRHFLLFYLICIVTNVTVYFLTAEHYNSHSDKSAITNVFHLFYPIILCIIMIKSYRVSSLDFLKRIIPVIVLITFQIITTIILNLINPYDRIITNEHAYEGIEQNLIYGSIQLIILSLVLSFNSESQL
jgi:hypothetical protein